MVWIAVTGHRPDKLGGYNAHDDHRAIRRHMRDFLSEAPDGELVLVSGGALGIDQFWIEVGLHLELPVVVALPFKGYNDKWPAASRQKYEELLDKCWQVQYVCEPGYEPWKLQERNKWMVDNTDILVAYCTGQSSGTQNCIDYAVTQSKIVHEFNPDVIRKQKDVQDPQQT